MARLITPELTWGTWTGHIGIIVLPKYLHWLLVGLFSVQVSMSSNITYKISLPSYAVFKQDSVLKLNISNGFCSSIKCIKCNDGIWYPINYKFQSIKPPWIIPTLTWKIFAKYSTATPPGYQYSCLSMKYLFQLNHFKMISSF